LFIIFGLEKMIDISKVVGFLLLISCESSHKEMKKILFLHHSTGHCVWVGNTNKYLFKLTHKGDVQKLFSDHNKKNNTNYYITERIFPKRAPYGWNNYPYDYYTIWVKNGGEKPYMEETTLEMLTPEYDVIIFKHCFPVSRILEDTGTPNIDSDEKRLENYKVQYNALKSKMHEFPDKKFVVWTPAVYTKKYLSEEEGKRTREFYEWMMEEWDEKGDNIFIWDFYKYETEGNLFLLDENAFSPENSHPGRKLSGEAAILLSKFVIDVIESRIE
jgi:hypothetical protein